jgi:two-component system heavy metal sensor histidine kinase CusS
VIHEGAAIERKHPPRLFDRFYRADPFRNHTVTHRGLGLAIVAAIAEMQEGEPFATCADWRTTIGLRIPDGPRRTDALASHMTQLS